MTTKYDDFLGKTNITIHTELPRDIKMLQKGQRNITIHTE